MLRLTGIISGLAGTGHRQEREQDGEEREVLVAGSGEATLTMTAHPREDLVIIRPVHDMIVEQPSVTTMSAATDMVPPPAAVAGSAPQPALSMSSSAVKDATPIAVAQSKPATSISLSATQATPGLDKAKGGKQSTPPPSTTTTPSTSISTSKKYWGFFREGVTPVYGGQEVTATERQRVMSLRQRLMGQRLPSIKIAWITDVVRPKAGGERGIGTSSSSSSNSSDSGCVVPVRV